MLSTLGLTHSSRKMTNSSSHIFLQFTMPMKSTVPNGIKPWFAKEFNFVLLARCGGAQGSLGEVHRVTRSTASSAPSPASRSGGLRFSAVTRALRPRTCTDCREFTPDVARGGFAHGAPETQGSTATPSATPGTDNLITQTSCFSY